MSTTETIQKSEGNDQSVEEICEERVNELVENIKNGDFGEFFEVLETVRQIKGSYSLNNVMLINMQMPGASIVNGYNQWQDYGRYVREGENGITILAPKLYKACPSCRNTKKYHEKKDCDDPTPYDDWGKKCFGFTPVNVFDISQTEPMGGEESFELPEIGASGNGEEVFEALYNFACNHVDDVQIVEELPSGKNGLFKSKDLEIVVLGRDRAAMSGTLAHELAHYFVYDSNRDFTEAREEMIVEAVSYVVCEELGLDSSDSAKYIKSWENDSVQVDVLRKDIELIVEISNRILSEM